MKFLNRIHSLHTCVDKEKPMVKIACCGKLIPISGTLPVNPQHG
jgi:enamine deaminase RidA (YjgF/YER057c/UK114 family)